ncbi:MAG TPA: helix-turn-helix domain-containing GNAT family N-acetyltransferase [Stellaceae bacterium]|jgi:DNA-binding MarR family transcriptional regulator/GNAT superfamily N-acetyltransferase
MRKTDFDRRVAAVRRFNRFYTQKIGVLEEGLLQSEFSLAESRVIYELAQRDRPTAAELAKDLGLDAGYLSRILRSFERRGLVAKEPSETDGRQNLLSLTDAGRDAFAVINARSRDEISALLDALTEPEQQRLLAAMQTIETLLGAQPESRAPYLLRSHQPGDIGWIIHRHGALYAREYYWDETFEALVAEIGAKFIKEFDPKRERCWIAEKDGEIVGSVFVVRQSDEVAKLRLLYVEPQARGLGIGKRLVAECIRFARQAGYRSITLWTNDILSAARRIYEDAGFRLVHQEPHRSFGHDLVSETWELAL